MGLKEQIPEDIMSALRNKATLELSVLRMLQSALKNKEIDKNKEELTDEDVIGVVGAEIKKRRDAAQEFEKVNRQDAAEQEMAEIEILMKYMPEQMSEDEIRAAVKNAIEQVEAQSMKEIGQVMKVLMPELKGKADGSVVNRMVREELDD